MHECGGGLPRYPQECPMCLLKQESKIRKMQMAVVYLCRGRMGPCQFSRLLSEAQSCNLHEVRKLRGQLLIRRGKMIPIVRSYCKNSSSVVKNHYICKCFIGWNLLETITFYSFFLYLLNSRNMSTHPEHIVSDSQVNVKLCFTPALNIHAGQFHLGFCLLFFNSSAETFKSMQKGLLYPNSRIKLKDVLQEML